MKDAPDSKMIEGIEFSGIDAGIKGDGPDLGLVFFKDEVDVHALYTKNKVKAAHILYNRKVGHKGIRALLVNSGCANACTGIEGVKDLEGIARVASRLLDIKEDQILFASTGVIGKRLPVDRICDALPELITRMGPGHIKVFAHSIMTTDTFAKIVYKDLDATGDYRILGVAKGAGMINPMFATMLAFIFTNYPLSKERLKPILFKTAKETFEQITIDGDLSTNDTVMLFAKRSRVEPQSTYGFEEGLYEVMKGLAMMIVKDGEGATKVIHITVKGARSKASAEKIARKIANSPLVKTAFFGSDPNWGRIIAAAGAAGPTITPSKIEIIIDGITLVKNGVEVPFDEADIKRRMEKKEVELVVDLKEGEALSDIYTTDLTYDYIKINASYRT